MSLNIRVSIPKDERVSFSRFKEVIECLEKMSGEDGEYNAFEVIIEPTDYEEIIFYPTRITDINGK